VKNLVEVNTIDSDYLSVGLGAFVDGFGG